MRTVLTLTLFLSFTSISVVKKRVLPYGIIISNADLIVEGQIIEVSSSQNQYQFEITDFIKGQSSQKISVDIWEEWTCDHRIESPKIGQKLLLFLTKNTTNQYQIINDSTGELFIRDNDSLETFSYYKIFPKLDELKKGIKLFDESFKFHGELYGYGKDRYFEQLVSDAKIKKNMEENTFFKSTFEHIKHMIIK